MRIFSIILCCAFSLGGGILLGVAFSADDNSQLKEDVVAKNTVAIQLREDYEDLQNKWETLSKESLQQQAENGELKSNLEAATWKLKAALEAVDRLKATQANETSEKEKFLKLQKVNRDLFIERQQIRLKNDRSYTPIEELRRRNKADLELYDAKQRAERKARGYE